MGNNKIGFFTAEEQTLLEIEPSQQEALQDIFEQLRNPPDWIEAYEQTLFWALIFNTQDKRYIA